MKTLKIKLSEEAEALVEKAFEGIDRGKYVDYHAHILGLGTNDSGIWLSPDLFSPLHPSDATKTQLYINAAGINNKEEADIEYLQQLMRFVKSFPAKANFCLLALDKCYDENGNLDEHNSKMYVPNDWVYQICELQKEHFTPCISINPYRKDAVEELEKWAERGVKMLKWMPAVMGMDASSDKCNDFFEKMRELEMVLLTHAGEEENVPVMKFQPLNNPLLFRKPLDMGVQVIMAHCAGKGKSPDIDNDNKKVYNHELFLRLMDEEKYDGLLFGDISAMTQVNRMGEPLQAILERDDLHHRLIHGSDYPLPAMNALISTQAMQIAGYIKSEDKKPLNELYNFNPLLFDFVLKRTLRHPKDEKKKFADSIFIENRALGIPVYRNDGDPAF